MKKIIVLAFCLTLPACIAPPAITVASLALSGVSLVQTGKTLPDHALSSVSQRDCIMFRATRGEQICQTEIAAPDGAMVVAAGPTDATGTPWPEEITAVPAPLDRVPAHEPLPIQPVQVASLAPIALPAPLEKSVDPESAVLADAPTRAPSPEPAPLLARETRTHDVAITEPFDPSPTPTTIAEPRSDIAAKPKAAPTPNPTAHAENMRHLVIGSFRDGDRAAAHVRRLGDNDLAVVTASVKGRVQHRVVAGPYADADLAAAKRDFAARGIKGAWPIKLRKTPAGFQIAAR